MMNADILMEALKQPASEPPPGIALRPGTVSVDSFDVSEMLVLVDGDSEPVTVLSLVGGLMADTRVMVLFFPPQGAYVIGVIEQAPWKSVSTFGTNWSNLGGTSEVVQYRRDGEWVTLRGVATRAAGYAVAIFTLPTGYRPRARENFAIDSNAQAHSVITPAVNGGVEFFAGAAATATGYASLSGVRFQVA